MKLIFNEVTQRAPHPPPPVCSFAVIALTDAVLKVPEQSLFPQSGLIRLFYNYEI